MLRNTLYYNLKPFIPRPLRTALRRQLAQRLRKDVGGVWPIMPGSELAPEGWPFIAAAWILTLVAALILNDREAVRLSGRPDAFSAANLLASLGTTVVVTRGPQGAIGVEPDGRTVEVPALPAVVADPTGAGDLFAAAYVWSDLAGRPLEERLRLATSYASLSLERATDRQKGITLREFGNLLVL